MSALYSPGSVSYYREHLNWADVINAGDIGKLPTADSFTLIPFVEYSPGMFVGSEDGTAMLIAVFQDSSEDAMNKFRRLWV